MNELTQDNNPATHDGLLLAGVAACFLLSGFAALLYQMAWMRQLSTVFGTSEVAVATVLSAYMAGLALGSAIAGRIVLRIRKPVLFYGVLEAAIAISALMVPFMLAGAGWLYTAVLGNQVAIPSAGGIEQPLYYFIATFLVLVIPTACMGATLPILTRYVVNRDDQIGSRVGSLYAINTLGAVGGAMAAGFLLLPTLGLRGTIWAGVAVNLIVFILAVVVAKQAEPQLNETRNPKSEMLKNSDSPVAQKNRHWIILPIMTASGICTFVYEVLWTRLLSHILGGSVSAFAIMLSSFLIGIVLGSIIASRLATSRTQAATAFVICQIGISLTSVFIYYAINHYLPTEIDYRTSIIAAFLVLMPATLFIGATFPLAVRIYASNVASAARSSAQVYAWNTIGAIIGAGFAGFVLIPILKYEGTIQTVVVINLLLAVCTTFTVTEWNLNKTRIMRYGSIATLLMVAVLYRPELPEQVLRYSPLTNKASGEIIYYDVGRSSTVLVYRDRGAFNLRNNGLPEAAAMPKGSPNAFANQRMLGALPVIARPDAKTALIVGLGTGTAVTGLPPTIESVDVIELEPKVVEANQIVADRRKNNPLQDPRLNIIVNDARSAFALSSKKYDMIVSQPSHPWSAGASHLYTREYMQMVKDHLNDEGVFLQWINSQFVDEALLKSLCATILDVYPNVRIYQWSPQVLFFLAADQPLDIEKKIIESGRPFKDAPLFYNDLGVATSEDLIAALMMDEDGVKRFAADSRVITDNYNMMAMESGRLKRQGRQLTLKKLSAVFRPWVPALNPESWVHRELGQQLQFQRVADKFSLLGVREYVPELITTLNLADNGQSELLAGNLLSVTGKIDQAAPYFDSALRKLPESNTVKYSIVRPLLRRVNRDDTPQSVKSVAASMTGSALAVIQASTAAAQQELQIVANLDKQLAAANPADPWFTEAVKLRVDWRSSVSNPELKEEFAQQSWQILDQAMASERDHEFLAMRIFAASQGNLPLDVTESARGYIDTVDFQLTGVEQNHISPGAAELQLKLKQIQSIMALVTKASASNDVSDLTRQEVLSGLEDIAERIEQLLRRPPSD